MIVDGEALPDGHLIEADVCVVGAGAAGISIAHELRARGVPTCVLESGGLLRDRRVEALAEGIGPDGARTRFGQGYRYFGGGTNGWGGNCAPFDPIDFAPRDFVPNASWPIGLDELAAYYPRADALCGLEPGAYDLVGWEGRDARIAQARLRLAGSTFGPKMFQRNPLRFGEVYRPLFDGRAGALDAYLNTLALGFETDPGALHVTALRAGTLRGRRFRVQARLFVLAAGIDNARLLLASRDVNPRGLGNDRDTVGRFFIGHLHFHAGLIVGLPPYRDLTLYSLPGDLGITAMTRTRAFAGLRLSEARQREQRVLNYVAMPAPLAGLDARAVHALAQGSRLGSAAARHATRVALLDGDRIRAPAVNGPATAHEAGLQDVGPPVHAIRNWVEQAPDAENRIVLDEEIDAAGLPRLRLIWRLGELERRTLKHAHAALDHTLRRSGLGQVVSEYMGDGDDGPPATFTHYMGSTRMSSDPRRGVVDRNCRVHDVDNLYLAGGSVMPTAGATMVTYNLVALAIRLADHLASRLGRPPPA